MERDSRCPYKVIVRQNFNSHAHVERDIRTTLLIAENCISTHTLTWSVTMLRTLVISVPTISTHTLTWSVTSFID